MVSAFLCVHVLVSALVLLIVVARVCILELTYVVLRVLVAIEPASEPVHALALRSEPALVLVSGPALALALHLAVVRVSVPRLVLERSYTCKCT